MLLVCMLSPHQALVQLTSTEYALLGDLLREADKLEEVLITIGMQSRGANSRSQLQSDWRRDLL
jgi:hypothetical protein